MSHQNDPLPLVFTLKNYINFFHRIFLTVKILSENISQLNSSLDTQCFISEKFSNFDYDYHQRVL